MDANKKTTADILIEMNDDIKNNPMLELIIKLILLRRRRRNIPDDEELTTSETEKITNLVKGETSETKLNSVSTNILFMFLGDMPFDNIHFDTFFKTTDKTFYIIVHPQKLDNYMDKINKNDFYKKLYEDGRLLIVDSEHHVRTAWATFSLVSATLLMIQYALFKKGNIFKKYVLLSSADQPLYNYQVIFNELNADSKSWIYYSGEKDGYARNFLNTIYTNQGGIFTPQDVNYVSQWMALDIQHIPYFIDFTTSDFKTYKKIENINCSGSIIDVIDAINKESKFNKYIYSFMGDLLKNEFTKDELEKIIDNGFCVAVDEYYFGAVIKYNLKTVDDIKKNIRFQFLSELNKLNQNEFINPIENEETYLLDNSTIYKNWLDTSKTADTFRTWYGSTPQFGDSEIRIQIIKNKSPTDNNDKYFLIKNKQIIALSDNDLSRLQDTNKDSAKTYYESLGLRGGSYNGSTGNFINFGKVNKIDLKDIYTLSSTYTDWSCVNGNPENMFRDFDSKLFTNNNQSMFEKNIKEIINNSEPYDLIKNKLEKNKRKDEPVIELYIKGPSYHPMEYQLFTLKSLINAYNLIIFFELDNPDKTILFHDDQKVAKEIYLSIINKNLSHIDSLTDDKTYYYFKDNVPDDIKNKKYGHPITSFSLNNALAYGALFIRKVMNDSLMDKYTNQLMSLNTYVLKDTKTWNIRNIRYKDNESVIFKNSQGGLASGYKNTYYNKYIKYKNKYLKLKNKI